MSGGEQVRAFFAVELPAAVREGALRAAAALRPHAPQRARWTPGENLHLTLKFLDSLGTDLVPKLIASAATRIAREQPFEVELAGLGAFPHARRARVLWLGVARGAPELARLARRLETAAAKCGVPRERRPYRAHLTLARLREPGPVAVERATAPSVEPFPVQEVVLFESRLAPTGSTYVPLARLPLQREGQEADALLTEFAPEI